MLFLPPCAIINFLLRRTSTVPLNAKLQTLLCSFKVYFDVYYWSVKDQKAILGIYCIARIDGRQVTCVYSRLALNEIASIGSVSLLLVFLFEPLIRFLVFFYFVYHSAGDSLFNPFLAYTCYTGFVIVMTIVGSDVIIGIICSIIHLHNWRTGNRFEHTIRFELLCWYFTIP